MIVYTISMRFTRYSATLLFVFSIGGVVITGMLYFNVVPFPADSILIQTIYAFLLLFPFIVAPVGFLLVYSTRHAFHFSPHTDKIAQEEPPTSAQSVTKEDDSFIHLGIGYMVAVLQDFSLGRILNRELYSGEIMQQIERELEFLRVYMDRGFLFHFSFHHEKQHTSFVRYRINENDIVIEVQGFFDYYFEHQGVRRSTPYDHDLQPPLIDVQGYVRVRLQQDKRLQRFMLVGFFESIRGSQMGLATE